tara:strand:- start:143 stop:2059 length:1917 start_codon:yes stop_codon:yes gene_type:complete
MAEKDIKYLNKDFSSFRDSLVEFAKNYFPDTYNDFNESSPGMMFIEMSSYVGDVLSYYTDYQLRESLLSQAQERTNILDIANSLGYKAKASVPAYTDLSVYQYLPAKEDGSGNSIPDMAYALKIPIGMEVGAESNSEIKFTTVEEVNFSNTGSSDTNVTVYSLDETTGEPNAYLIKTKVRAVSGESVSETFNITETKKFHKIKLGSDKVIQIQSVVDADQNKWYNVPYLAQDTIFEEIQNNSTVDPTTSGNQNEVPYLLNLRRTGRRFTTKIDKDNFTELLFGAGISTSPDELIVPNPSTIGNVLQIGETAKLDVSFDPANMMFTRAYGKAPSSNLTVTYLTGGGIASNVVSGDLTKIVSNTFNIDEDGLSSSTLQTVKDSLAVTNEYPATGGRSAESNEEIRQNAMASYASQNRAVTKEDYISRVYAMPSKFGSIAKAYITRDDIVNNLITTDTQGDVSQSSSATLETNPNPLALNLYVLSYDINNNLTVANDTTKRNLQTYLSQYRILTDAINIRNGFVVNIGIDFEIIVLPSFNGKEVLARTIDRVKKYFDVEKWQFNQPILLNDLAAKLSVVEGVQALVNIKIKNNVNKSSGYSGNEYNIDAATSNNVIYPSQDPCIFEVKFPDTDIRGKVVGY